MGGDAVKNGTIYTWPCAFVLALALVSYSTSSIALGSAEDRAACTPDVFRLCGSEIPNVTKIIACLKAKKAELSPGCKTAFNPPAATTTASRTRSMDSSASSWCDFHGVARDPGQQDWLKWCGSAVRK
jgi:hypothetical protein